MGVDRKRLLHTGYSNYDHVELDAGSVFFASALRSHVCPCCSVVLHEFEHDLQEKHTSAADAYIRWLSLHICLSCGWWNFRRDLEYSGHHKLGQPMRASWWELTHALQTEIDLGLNSLPIDMLRNYLLRHWDDRKLISSQQAEDLVAAVLKEHHGGSVVRTSANANAADGGIDLYLAIGDDGGIRRAVQVKRRIRKEVEAVEDVRNFVGSMVLSGLEKGVFVTTASRFTKAARAVPKAARDAKVKLELDLIDGEQLLELLHMTNNNMSAQVPPEIALDQIWRSSDGRTFLARDLFSGDLGRLSRL